MRIRYLPLQDAANRGYDSRLVRRPRVLLRTAVPQVRAGSKNAKKQCFFAEMREK